LKGIAIGLSNNSKEILKRLKKTEFVKDIYIAGSSKEDGKENELIQVQKPREILLKKWPEIDLIIFIGSIAASIRIINPFLTSKDQDPGVIVIDNKCSKIVPLIGLHQSNTQNISCQIANLLGGEIIETNNSNDQSLLNLDAFGNQWGWKRSGKINDWSKLVIKQAKNEEIFCKQLSGNSLWKTSESAEIINQIDKKKSIAYFCGDYISSNLDIELKNEGFQVDKIINYTSEKITDLNKENNNIINNHPPDIIFIYSKRSAESFIEIVKKYSLNGMMTQSRVLRISEKVLSVFKHSGWKKLEVFQPGEELEKLKV